MSRPVLLFGLVLGLSVLVAGDAAAQREGFIAGIGTGPGFTAQDVDRDVGSRLGLATDLKVGAMLSESVQLYATGKWNAFSDWGTLIASGLGGLGVTYEMASGFNLNGAAGVAMWIDFDWAAEVGFGLGAGFGYEFADMWVLNLDGMWGMIGDGYIVNIVATIGVLSH